MKIKCFVKKNEIVSNPASTLSKDSREPAEVVSDPLLDSRLDSLAGRPQSPHQQINRLGMFRA